MAQRGKRIGQTPRLSAPGPDVRASLPALHKSLWDELVELRQMTNEILGRTDDAEQGLEDANTALAAIIPAGTAMLFVQASAPTGWTKVTTHDDVALRVVSGTGGGTGGTVDFTAAFTSHTIQGTTDAHTLTADEIPAHRHFSMVNAAAETTGGDHVNVTASLAPTLQWNNSSGADTFEYALYGSATEPTVGRTSQVGGGQGHDHDFESDPLDLAVKYVDCLIATRDAPS